MEPLLFKPRWTTYHGPHWSRLLPIEPTSQGPAALSGSRDNCRRCRERTSERWAGLLMKRSIRYRMSMRVDRKLPYQDHSPRRAILRARFYRAPREGTHVRIKIRADATYCAMR